jgi:hypothetical protein
MKKGRTRQVFELAQYLLSVNIQLARKGLQPCSEFVYWRHGWQRRLTSLEMADRQAHSATNSFLTAALHVFFGCIMAIRASRSYLRYAGETLSILPKRSRQYVQELEQQKENTASVLPCDKSNLSESLQSTLNELGLVYQGRL